MPFIDEAQIADIRLTTRVNGETRQDDRTGGATVPKGRFIQPRVEAEIAFVMKTPLKGPIRSIEEVIAATDHVRLRSRSSTPASSG